MKKTDIQFILFAIILLFALLLHKCLAHLFHQGQDRLQAQENLLAFPQAWQPNLHEG